MKKQPLVSVCIPAYNMESYIGRAIESVLGQSYTNLEIIVVDDGSTDNTFRVTGDYENHGVRLFRQANKGAGAARNACLAAAGGDFVQFLDGDDLLSPDKIARQVELLADKPGMVAVCSTIHFRDKTDHLAGSPSAYEESFLKDDGPPGFLSLLYGVFGNSGSMVQPNAWLTPMEVIKKAGPWNEELTLDDDGEFFCRVIAASAGVRKSGGYNYYRKYALQKTNLSALKQEQHLESQYKAILSKLKTLETLGVDPAGIDKLRSRWLYDLLFRAYPEHVGLVSQLQEALKGLAVPYEFKFNFGSPAGKLIYRLLGWKAAKRLQLLIHAQNEKN